MFPKAGYIIYASRVGLYLVRFRKSDPCMASIALLKSLFALEVLSLNVLPHFHL